MNRCSLMLVILFLLLMISFGLYGEEFNPADSVFKGILRQACVKSPETKYYLKLHLNAATVLSKGIGAGIGITTITPKHCWEHVIMMTETVGVNPQHAYTVRARAVYYQMNFFPKPRVSGFFLKVEAGGMGIYKEPPRLTFGKAELKSFEGYFPVATIGFGGSLKLYKTSTIRISLDAGFKVSPVNLNLTLVL